MTDDDCSNEPEVFLQLPLNGPMARGRLLPGTSRNGRRNFVVYAQSPARAEMVPSMRRTGSLRLHTELIADGTLTPSVRHPGWLELTRDVHCTSPSQGAELLTGRSANGFVEWKTSDGRPLGDFMAGVAAGPNGAWLVRGSNVGGLDLVERLWRPENLVSFDAGRLTRDDLHQGISKDRLRAIVENDFATASYGERQELVEDVHNFLSRMKPGDLVVTLSGGTLFLGEITGAVERTVSPHSHTDLRRPVEWREVGYDFVELPDELKQRLSFQRDVVDLGQVRELLRGLGVSDEELARELEDDPTVEAVVLARRELELPDPGEELAAELLIARDWLQEVRDLLWDDRQIVLYGPPGTGKTYLAQHLAEFLGGGPEQVKLVQFHPSYSYEDFFEGFRPREDPKSGEVAFRITAGPLRELADLASREGNRHIPHFLIIDELNRANLAKVFGELYFLLEYRNKSVRLTYSGDDFALPPNLFVIGTMNTADRSIALVDAAMRRRFAFVELSPRTEPTKGLLHRWLAREGKDPEPALLLDALNARIPGEDFKIGPSYLMKPGVYREGGLNRAWRTKILPLLEEHHYGEDVNVATRYGLASLRRAVARPATLSASALEGGTDTFPDATISVPADAPRAAGTPTATVPVHRRRTSQDLLFDSHPAGQDPLAYAADE